MPDKRRLPAGALLLLAFCGCNVAPKYAPPRVTAPAAFKESPPAYSVAASTEVWRPAQPKDAALKGKWWELFQDPELDALEDRLDIDNQNIAQYLQNFMAARAQVAEARAGLFPTLSAAPSATRTTAGAAGFAGGGGGLTTNSSVTEYQLPLEASWAPDLWGRVRSTVSAARAAAQVSAADLENERLTEQAALAVYFFELRGQDSLQELYNATVAADARALELTKALAQTGIDSDLAVAQAEVTLKTAQAAAAGVAANRAVYEHAIATLIGQPASSFSLPVRGLAAPVPAIPVGVPSQLLERRPDVAAAERAMAQANALIGVAKAAYFPTLSLTATAGLEGGEAAGIVALPSLFWALGASASELLFDAGLRKATVAQYAASYKASEAAYRQTALTAFQQVEDELATLRVASEQLARQQAAVASARRYLERALAGYQTGIDPYLDVITAQTTLLSDQQTELSLRVTEMTAAVGLIQALGGGWDAAELSKEPKTP